MEPAVAITIQDSSALRQGLIVVIADDFTGAAELAGISLRYGLTVDLSLGTVHETTADVFIVCTDSRSMKREAALLTTEKIIKDVIKLNAAFIYKKVDSVLRGYVLDEIILQMNLSGGIKTFLVPANPSLGRTISNGSYFINEKKITETGFVNDPEFPINSDCVKQMIGGNGVRVLRNDDCLPDAGVIICEATSDADISTWAALSNNKTLLAGAGDFYNALLTTLYQPRPTEDFAPAVPHLYVCGTAFTERKAFIKTLGNQKQCVVFLPIEINHGWIEEACAIARSQKRLVIAIGEGAEPASLLRCRMAKAVKQILAMENITEIFIEGGSTAAAVLQELDTKQLQAVNELQRGVVRMKAGDLYITVKPGSYPLPKQILELY